MKSGAELVRVAREVAATAALLSPALIFRFMPAENADDGGPFRIPGLSRDVATEAAGELGARVWGGGIKKKKERLEFRNLLSFSTILFLLANCCTLHRPKSARRERRASADAS